MFKAIIVKNQLAGVLKGAANANSRRSRARDEDNKQEGVDAMTATEQVLIEKMKQLPPQRMAEVEDFIDFLRTREDQQRLSHEAAKASEASFSAVWDNNEDAAYDRM